MSEAIASMDRQKDELDHLIQAQRSATQVNQIYQQYNRAVLADKLQKALNQQQQLQGMTKQQQAEEAQRPAGSDRNSTIPAADSGKTISPAESDGRKKSNSGFAADPADRSAAEL